MDHALFTRPYLVIPKLVEQPTWGGHYIITSKGWESRPEFAAKIGQSYELFSGSNFSLLTSTEDPGFTGELTDRDAVQIQTHPLGTVSLSDMLAADAEAVLGKEVIRSRGYTFALLIKFTQALGNSFQIHLKTDAQHPKWKSKPESWYYFEPGVITLGVKPGSWDAYKAAVSAIDTEMHAISNHIQSGDITIAAAQSKIQSLLDTQNPWQYVNHVQVKKDQLIDLSQCGIHHSWEEDPIHAPLGSVLYEMQLEMMDDISTIRSFDKGKLNPDGSIRDTHIDDYFALIDRSPAANTPATHFRQPQVASKTTAYTHEHLLETPYYNLDTIKFHDSQAVYTEAMTRFKHLFVKSGHIRVEGNGVSLTVGGSHSCFIPAAVQEYSVTSLEGPSEILVSY